MRIAVTGAFGYSGRYITKRLLDAGHEVITLTNSMHRANPFGEKVRAFPFHFEQPDKLRDSLREVDALVNTYWVRFDHRLFTLRIWRLQAATDLCGRSGTGSRGESGRQER